MRVFNMVSPSTGVEVANQFIIEGDGKTTFQSYRSTIIEIDKNAKTIKFGEDWDYSNTTRKYRNEFFCLLLIKVQNVWVAECGNPNILKLI